jgi:hypothetical protein
MATTCKLIARQVLTGTTASVTFSDIPQTGYTDLVLVASMRTNRNAATDVAKVRFNGATSDTSHSTRGLEGDGSAIQSFNIGYCSLGTTNGNTSTSNTFGSLEVYIPNYAGSTSKSYSATGLQENNAASAFILALAGRWDSTNAITSFSITSELSSSFLTGSSFFLYGISKA